jgi:hypothetical protein
LKCPAEENGNCGKSPLTNARKSCGKTDTRTSKVDKDNFKDIKVVSKSGGPMGLWF